MHLVHFGSFFLISVSNEVKLKSGALTVVPDGITPFLMASLMIWMLFRLPIAAAPNTLLSLDRM